jgi:UDP-glucose 4-epimerase
MLIGHGHLIRAASRNPAGIASAFADTVAMPSPGSGHEAWMTLLEGVDHVVHCAGLAHTSGLPDSEYFRSNTLLTGEFAAAAAAIAGKFVFMSSVRAVCGPISANVVDADTPPAPTDAYGRSKLRAEEKVRDAFSENGRFTILRPVLVYGPGVKGNLRSLLRLAAVPAPLPFAGLSAGRSLLDVNACAAAVEHALFAQTTNGGTYLVSDRKPVSTAQILAAFRRGLGRGSGLFELPPALLAAFFAAGGQSETWTRVSGSLITDPSELAATGWNPVEDSTEGLERLARALYRRNGNRPPFGET